MKDTIVSALEELELVRQHGFYLKKQFLELLVTPNQVKKQSDHPLFWLNPDNFKYLNFVRNSEEIVSYDELLKFDCQAPSNALYFLVENIFNAGLDVYIVDVTSDDIRSHEMFVVRAIIPNAHPLSFGFGYDQFDCKRLYSVPNYLGYNVPESFNTIPHPYP